MKIAIFGATGGTGHHLVEQALASGHQVTALVRTTGSLPVTDKRLRIVPGDVRDPSHVAATIAGHDAIMSALGPNQRGPVSLCGDAIANILAAMPAAGVRRLIALSAYGVADSRHRNLYVRMVWALRKEKMVDKERMEALLRRSDVDWTILRPSALANGPQTGRYRLGTDLQMRITSRISRADLAEGMLRQLTDATFVRRAPAITS